MKPRKISDSLSLEEIVRKDKVTPKEKRTIHKEVKKILLDVIEEAHDVAKISEKGIDGLNRYIPNPFYEEGNGNGNDEEPKFVPVPAFYQARAVDFFLRKKRVLMAHEMGTGKSWIGVADAIALENKLREKNPEKNLKTVIVCPGDMRKTWNDRLHEYISKERVGNPLIIDGYSEEKLKQIDKANFVIVSYSAFAFDENKDKGNIGRKKLKEKLLKNVDFVILDEVHNAKNASQKACISNNLRDITDKVEHLCMLSGTPIVNTLPDAYSLISFLEPENYKTPKDAAMAYSRRPDLIRNILNLRSLRKEAKDIYKLPKLNEEVIKITLNEKQRRVYNALYENDSLAGYRKLQLIEEVLLDPKLLKNKTKNKSSIRLEDILNKEELEILESVKSSKYEALDKIVEEAARENKKVVIFSPLFTEGVTKAIEKRYAEYGCLRLDGTNKKDREKIRGAFQDDKEGKYKVLVASDVAGEGISLTSASVCVFLDDPYAPGQRDQMIKRLHRPGQKKDVFVYSLIVPNTVDQGVLEFLDEKKKIIDFIFKKGAPLTERQKIIMSDLNTIKRYLGETPIGRYLFSDRQKLNRYISNMEGLGADEILKSFKKSQDRIPKFIAEKYPLLMEDRAPANVSYLYGQIIKGIEQIKKLKRKVDLGSGPSVLANALKEQVVSVDLNKYNFQHELYKNKKNIVSTIGDTPLKEKSFDLALCSLVLDETSNRYDKKSKNSEREKCFREANRILEDKGIYIVVLPYGVITDKQTENWEKGAKKIGFRIIPELTGYAYSEDRNFRTYIATMQKFKNPQSRCARRYFSLDVDQARTKWDASQSKPGFYTNFYLNGKLLEECIEKARRSF